MNSEVWTAADAATYDDDVADMFSPDAVDPAVDVLVDLAGGGPALEFAIGTGRVALPLADRGVEVTGIELSQPMIDALLAKPGSDRIRVVHGDMATTRVDGRFSLVYLVFNTISNLLTQDAQVACFENAAAHLAPGGRFVVEVGVPDLQRLPRGERFVPFHVSADHVGIDEYDIVDQMLVSHHITTRDGVTSRSSGRFRYAWPAEYDLMARIAGLRQFARWEDWQRNPFNGASTRHVSVWECPA